MRELPRAYLREVGEGGGGVMDLQLNNRRTP